MSCPQEETSRGAFATAVVIVAKVFLPMTIAVHYSRLARKCLACCTSRSAGGAGFATTAASLKGHAFGSRS